MAIIYPTENIQFTTKGESFIFNNILKQLPIDWYVFYEPVINGRTPDFIIFNRNFGLIVIEVKDFTIETIIQMNHYKWIINSNLGETTITSPIKQCLDYRNEIYNLLVEKEELRTKSNTYSNRLKLPITYMCAFPNIDSIQAKKIDLEALFPAKHLLLKNDINNINNFIYKLNLSLSNLFNPINLTKVEEKLIVSTIFPEFKQKNNRDEKIKFTHSLTHSQFESHVEEVHHVVDRIAHFINTQSRIPSDFCITYNHERLGLISSAKYTQTLYDYLDFKNFLYEPHNNNNNNHIIVLSYSNLINYNLERIKYIFMLDLNSTPADSLTKHVIPFLIKNHSLYNIELTSNKPFDFMKIIELITSDP